MIGLSSRETPSFAWRIEDCPLWRQDSFGKGDRYALGEAYDATPPDGHC